MTEPTVGDELGRVVPLVGLARRGRADQVVDDMFDGWRHQQLTKDLVARPSPVTPDPVAHASGFSFPSVNAAGSAAV